MLGSDPSVTLLSSCYIFDPTQFSELHTRNLTRDRVVLPLSELKIITPNILWEELLGMVFKNTRINNQYRVIIENVEYFK